MQEYTGIVNILKPPGMTSSNVVVDVRRLFEVKKAGHMGTLDPGAAGVLPVCIGKATRLFDFFVDKDKEYIAEIAFGKKTDTQDSYGRITETSQLTISLPALQGVLPRFMGRIAQTAPGYSAVKSGGQALYKLARAGKAVPERIREVEIHALECMVQTGENRFLLRVVCSRGTYVRTLCEDIGNALHACAHMSFLLRTRTGGFMIGESFSIPELTLLKERGGLSSALISVETALSELEAVHVPQVQAKGLLNGCTVEHPALGDALYRIYGERFLGVGTFTKDGLRMKIQF